MLVAASFVLPLVTAGVLLSSGIAKLRRPEDLAGWAELGVPAALRREWLLRLHPWAEIALAVALVLFGGVLGLIVGLVSVALMVAYLALIGRALRTTPDASCSCFGTRRKVTHLTVARNVWLTVIAVVTTIVIWTTPLWGGAVAGIWTTAAWGWIAMALVAVATALVIVWPDPPAAPAIKPASAHLEVPASEDELDYVRVRIPSVPVTLADGSTVNLRNMAASRPHLLLAVSATCSSCASTIASAPAWRALLPELEVRLLLRNPPTTGSFAEHDEPQSLHDPEGYISGTLGEWSTPTAVLLGADGLLAGGPVTGADAITEFVADIRASLDEAAAAVTSP